MLIEERRAECDACVCQVWTVKNFALLGWSVVSVPADCSQTNRQWPAWQHQTHSGQRTAGGRAADSRAGDGHQGSGHHSSGPAGSGHQGSQQPAASNSGQAAATGQPQLARPGPKKLDLSVGHFSVRWALFLSSTFRPRASQFPISSQFGRVRCTPSVAPAKENLDPSPHWTSVFGPVRWTRQTRTTT